MSKKLSRSARKVARDAAKAAAGNSDMSLHSAFSNARSVDSQESPLTSNLETRIAATESALKNLSETLDRKFDAILAILQGTKPMPPATEPSAQQSAFLTTEPSAQKSPQKHPAEKVDLTNEEDEENKKKNSKILTSAEKLKATLNITPNVMFPRMLTATLEPFDLKELTHKTVLSWYQRALTLEQQIPCFPHGQNLSEKIIEKISLATPR